MPTHKETCQELQKDLADLRALAEQFDRAFDAGVASGDLSASRILKAEIESSLAALKEKLVPPEVRELHIERQYAEQVAVLEAAGLLEVLENGEKGIRGIDGKPYPLPSLETINARFRSKEAKETVKEKSPQGFKKLVLVPFAMSLDALTAKYGERIKEHHSAGKLMYSDGTVVPADKLNINQPVYTTDDLKNADQTGALVYNPTSFDATNHGGKTKAQILAIENPADISIGPSTPEHHTPGWRILLMEELPDLPAEGAGQTVGNRKQLEANKSANEYLAQLKTGPYANEHGLTPEDGLALALTNLETKGQVTDDFRGKGKAAYLTGAWLPGSLSVPIACWSRGDRQAVLGGGGAVRRFSLSSARSAARI